MLIGERRLKEGAAYFKVRKVFHMQFQNFFIDSFQIIVNGYHYVKIFRIRSYFGPHFPAFGLNTERYGVSLRIQSESGKMRTRITPNTDTFHAVYHHDL